MKEYLNKLYIKVKKWLLPILLAVGGILDFTTELLPHIAMVVNIDPKYANIVRVTMLVVTAIITKMNSDKIIRNKINEIEVV